MNYLLSVVFYIIGPQTPNPSINDISNGNDVTEWTVS